MLVLSRKVSEQIVIDDDIRIQVIEVRGNRVRLGITAPEHVRVLRSELKEFEKQTADGNGSMAIVEKDSPSPYLMAHAS